MKKKTFFKKALIVTMSVVMLSSVSVTQVCAREHSYGRQNDRNQRRHQQQERSGDYIPEQPTEQKVSMNEFKQMDNATGRTQFWNSVDATALEEYYINEDLSVEFKNKNNKSSSDVAEKQKFEKNLKQYVSKVEDYCEKEGMEFNDMIVDGKGGLNVGSLSGNGNGTNTLSVSSLVKGDIILLNDGGTQIYGAIMHAGIYDGTKVDLCIYSASPNATSTCKTTGVRWERVSDWRKNDQAWTMNVKGTTKKQRETAFNYVRKYATVGEKYDWSASKSSTSKWYCSKIPWYAYKNSSVKIDIDYDGGYWCYPIDIYNSSKTNLIKYYK